MTIRLKRAYDKPAKDDGYRVLVDRIWPRGVSRESAQLDEWLKEIAPSTALRKWFNHDVNRWEEFKKRYLLELSANRKATNKLAEIERNGRLTLVFGAADREHNNGVVLKEFLQKNPAPKNR